LSILKLVILRKLRYIIIIIVLIISFLTNCKINSSDYSVYLTFYKTIGGDFSLTDQYNKIFNLKDHRNKVILLFFGYTTCPDVCPTTLAKINNVYTELGSKSKEVLTVFVSVDPERDTPSKLKDYITHFDINALALTGKSDDILKVSKQYKIFYQKNLSKSAVGYLIDHSTYTYLIDQQGKVRHIFKHDTKVDFMVGLIKYLLNKKS